MRQWVTVLGSTGSIGSSTLDVIRQHPDKYKVYALTAARRVNALAEQIIEFEPLCAVIGTELLAQQLKELLPSSCKTELLWGEAALSDVASAQDVDQVMASIVGGSRSFAYLGSGKSW